MSFKETVTGVLFIVCFKVFIGLFLMVDDMFVYFAHFMFLSIPLPIISAMAFGIMETEPGIPYESG